MGERKAKRRGRERAKNIKFHYKKKKRRKNIRLMKVLRINKEGKRKRTMRALHCVRNKIKKNQNTYTKIIRYSSIYCCWLFTVFFSSFFVFALLEEVLMSSSRQDECYKFKVSCSSVK